MQEEPDIALMRCELLEQLQIPVNAWKEVFFNRISLRLNYDGFALLKKTREFKKVEATTGAFKVQDLRKISLENKNFFYIDSKKSIIYTLDTKFAAWC